MDLHQEVRAYRHVEGFGHMRDLQPRRDAADAGDIDLHDRAGARFEIVLELGQAVHRLADGDRHRGRLREPAMRGDIVGMDWFLEPGGIERFVMARATDSLVQGQPLVGIGHDLPAKADLFAHGRKPAHVFRDMRAADLDLGAAEADFLGLDGFVDQFESSMWSQPPSV